MAKRVEAKELFTASEVARFCQVDLKTIHNWAERGEIRHFRTPGRHLRFRRADVLEFLRKFGYPLPTALRQGKPTVHLIDEDAGSLRALQDALGDRYEVSAFSEPVDALIAVGTDQPDLVVLDVAARKLDGVSAVERLRSMEATRHVRVVVYSADEAASARALRAGASAFIRRPDEARLLESLESLLASER